MASRSSILGTLADLFVPSSRKTSAPNQTEVEPGRYGDGRTVEVDPPSADALRISYAPHTDGDPDAGEIVWTWVPYEENDGRGKDRPVLIIATAPRGRVYAVKLTSKSHDGDRDYLSIGSGGWDSRGRESWVDIEQLYSVDANGMRREAAALARDAFRRVASALATRYGWVLEGGSSRS